MQALIDSFRMGGFGMIPTAFFGLVLVVVSVVYLRRPDRALVAPLVSLGVLTLAAGGFGFVTGLIASATALGPGTDPRLLEVGIGESLHNLSWALAFIMMASLFVSASGLRVAFRVGGNVPTEAR